MEDLIGWPIGRGADTITIAHITFCMAFVAVVVQARLAGQDDSLEGLMAIKDAQVALAASLLRDKVPAPEVQAVLSRINRDIHCRILDSHLAEMASGSWGAPPVAFELIIMGSGGRGENFLYPDQDNGFILDDYPDEDHDRIDGFFIELAERMTRDLDRVGFPLCNGFVMATNPLWRKTRTQWRDQVRIWGRKRSTIAAQHANILFDFQGAYGTGQMAADLRGEVTAIARSSPTFLMELTREADRAGVALGWFGRFDVEKEEAGHKGEINLKYRGTLPLVTSLRLLALRAGIEETSSLGRIAALHRLGLLNANDADYLSCAFAQITSLLLRQQLNDFEAGKRVTNFVHPKTLSKREKKMLVDFLKAIDGFAKGVHAEFTGEVL
jgi:signal-transduction protein with cAMP-binding, CBS, and nucleotidyltransferase domain